MRIVVSCGDCNGIGLEVFAKAMMSDKIKSDQDLDFTLICNSLILEEYYNKTGIAFQITQDTICFFKENEGKESESKESESKDVNLIDCVSYPELDFGIVSKTAGLMAAESLNKALVFLDKGSADAILTLPIQKEAMYLAGWEFPGHTEMLAKWCGTKEQVMILGNQSLKVALATVHIPLKNVSGLLNAFSLKNKLLSLHKTMVQDFGIDKPKIAVLGLNPHAGENGNIGTEDVDIIEPLINEIRAEYGETMIIDGPKASDGFFGFGEYKNYDAVLAMYHDQGLIPLKLISDGGGVNYTANLPIVRVSPDHGTAYALAGQNKANPKSTIEAIEMAMEVVNNRKMNN